MVAALLLRLFLGAVFLLASVPKLVAHDDFERAVVNYDLLPRSFASALGRLLPAAELVFAVALLVGAGGQIVAAAAAGCLLTFAGAAGINLMRGRRMECGCHGSAAPRTISWSLVVKDVVLAGAAIFVAVTPVTFAAIPWPEAGKPVASGSTAVSLYCIAAIAALVEAAALDLVDAARLVFRLERVEVFT